MNKDFLYFLEALHQIDRKYFKYNTYSNRKPSFMTLIEWGRLNIEWNKKDNLGNSRLETMQALAKELRIIGLEVSEISELDYSYLLVAKLPKNPTTELLYGKA